MPWHLRLSQLCHIIWMYDPRHTEPVKAPFTNLPKITETISMRRSDFISFCVCVRKCVPIESVWGFYLDLKKLLMLRGCLVLLSHFLVLLRFERTPALPCCRSLRKLPLVASRDNAHFRFRRTNFIVIFRLGRLRCKMWLDLLPSLQTRTYVWKLTHAKSVSKVLGQMWALLALARTFETDFTLCSRINIKFADFERSKRNYNGSLYHLESVLRWDGLLSGLINVRWLRSVSSSSFHAPRFRHSFLQNHASDPGTPPLLSLLRDHQKANSRENGHGC